MKLLPSKREEQGALKTPNASYLTNRVSPHMQIVGAKTLIQHRVEEINPGERGCPLVECELALAIG